MDSARLLPDHLMECARVYFFLSLENTTFFVINCLYCNKDYSEWLKFYKHVHSHHLENVQLQQTDDSVVAKIIDEKSNLEENVQLDKNSSENYDVKNEYLDEETSCCSEKNGVIKKATLINDLEYTNNVEFLEEYLSEDYEECVKISAHGKNLDMQKTTTSVSSCFYRLYTTDSKTMLKFIELLRQNPCQWDHKHNNFTHKDKRNDSTMNLTKQLNEGLNLNITPQGTRASVLYILRWFDREYIRFLNCQQNDFPFVCTYSEYFEKLLEFLPYQHLKPMKCDECAKRFKSEHLLMAHKHKYHNGQVPFRCRFCGHGFIHQSSHKMHENRHIKVHVWPCNTCLYQATSKSDYIKHLATHSSRQPHKCNICGLAYKTKTNLNVHLKSHSLPAYECEFCKKKFYEKYRYKRHIWLHDVQEMSGKSIDNFTCEICGRRFTNNKTLGRHQLVHMLENYKIEGQTKDCFQLIDVNVYYCDYCSLEFVHKEAYESHMNLKHIAVNIQ